MLVARLAVGSIRRAGLAFVCIGDGKPSGTWAAGGRSLPSGAFGFVLQHVGACFLHRAAGLNKHLCVHGCARARKRIWQSTPSGRAGLALSHLSALPWRVPAAVTFPCIYCPYTGRAHLHTSSQRACEACRRLRQPSCPRRARSAGWSAAKGVITSCCRRGCGSKPATGTAGPSARMGRWRAPTSYDPGTCMHPSRQMHARYFARMLSSQLR